MPDTKTITIQHETFEVSTPYAEGHTCTVAEAKALNQTRAENIRNNMAKVVSASREAAGLTDKDQHLSDKELAELQNAVTAYDATYEFTLASVGGGRKSRDPIEVEATKIARASIAAQLKDMGMTMKAANDKNPEALKAMIAELAENKTVIAAAKSAVAKRNKIAEETVGVADMSDFAA